MIFGRKEKKNNSRSQVTDSSNLCEVKKRGRLQHRLQLGIFLPCEARRTADQVPKNWVYGVIVKKDRQKGWKNLLFDHSEIPWALILYSDIAEVPSEISSFSLLSLGMFQDSHNGPRIFNRSLCLSLHQRTIFYNLKNGESLSELEEMIGFSESLEY